MIRKRRSLPSRKGKAAHPRRLVAPVRRRTTRNEGLHEEVGESFPVAETMLDKHELILAHAEARRSAPALPSRTGLVVGVLISVLIVCVGWFATFGMGLRSGQSSEGGLWDIVRGRSAELKDELKEPIEGAKDALKAYETGQTAKEAAMQQVAEEIRRGQASSTVGSTSSTVLGGSSTTSRNR